jgi:hypothetical protein
MADIHAAVTNEGAVPPEMARADHSRYVQRIRRRYAEERLWFLTEHPGVPLQSLIDSLISHLLAGGRPLASALRVARQLVLERLATLDVEEHGALVDVTLSMTHLAEVTLGHALAAAQVEFDVKYGAPMNDQGQRMDLWVIGMGKLGGRELNVSSDIDLIYVYEDDGLTTGVDDGRGGLAGQITVHEYFSHVVKRIYALIGDTTEDGFVFRVDLALRPNGNSGPAVVSLSMLEEYFLTQGREWERFAWLKSRIVAPRASMPGGERYDRALPLRDLIIPFVFRRYLDYGVFESLRQLHRKIRDEANRRAAGRPERANDVKLSRGGIRASNTASSTSTTSKLICCPQRLLTWPGSPPAWAWTMRPRCSARSMKTAMARPASSWAPCAKCASSWPTSLMPCCTMVARRGRALASRVATVAARPALLTAKNSWPCCRQPLARAFTPLLRSPR